MKLTYKLDEKDQKEVLRIHKLCVELGEWRIRKKLEGVLQPFKKAFAAHQKGKPNDIWYDLASVFLELQMHFFKVAIIERYKNKDLKRMRECLALSARCGYLMRLTAHSGGYDCLHVYEMLNALMAGDTFALQRFKETFSGPSKKGHRSSVVLCNGLYAVLDGKFTGRASAIKQLRERKGTRYDRCLFDGLIAITEKSEGDLRVALVTLIELQKRQSHLWSLDKVICSQAHALYRAWLITGGRAFADEMDLYLWDADVESYMSIKIGALTLDLSEFNPVVAKWIKTLPASVDRQELFETL